MMRPSPSAGAPEPESADPRHVRAVARLKRLEEREWADLIDV
jgi:hypothetical protein